MLGLNPIAETEHWLTKPEKADTYYDVDLNEALRSYYSEVGFTQEEVEYVIKNQSVSI